MKTKFNLKSLFLFALVLLVAFSFIACGDTDDEDATLSGTVTIIPEGDAYITVPLNAVYTGDESVSYQWKKGTTNVGTGGSTYTPTEAGDYTVTVSASGYESLISEAIDITAPDHAAFFGFWKWEGQWSSGPGVEELNISHNTFRLIDSDDESFTFQITKWELITGSLSVPSNLPAGSPSFTIGYTLTGTVTANTNDYENFKDKSITLYRDNEGNVLLRSRPEATVQMQDRIFEKQ